MPPELLQLKNELSKNQSSWSQKENQKWDSNMVSPRQKVFHKQKQKKVKIKVKTQKSQIKQFLITSINQQYLLDDTTQKVTEEESYLTLIMQCITSNWGKVCAMLFIINHMYNSNLLSLIYPLSLFLYALLENPKANRYYWNFMLIYTIVVLSLKFLYQLPIFCSSPPYTIMNYEECENIQLNEEELMNRIDYIIGIRKYTGPASYPLNEGFLQGVIQDYLVLLSLFVQKYIMLQLGIWNHMSLDDSLYRTPQFHNEENIHTMPVNHLKRINDKQQFNSSLSIISEENSEISLNIEPSYVKNEDSFNSDDFNKEKINQLNLILTQVREGKSMFYRCKHFFFRILPQYLPDFHKNSDLRVPYNTFQKTEYLKIKNGKDYYTISFGLLLVLIVYLLCFHANMTGSQISLSEALSKNEFSGVQVISLICIFMLMIIDRVLYKASKSIQPPEEQLTPKVVKRKKSYRMQGFKMKQKKECDFNMEKRDKDVSGLDRHTMLAKVIFHYFLVLYVHYYCFSTAYENNKQMENVPALMGFYFIFSLYLYFNCLQIQSGYPEYSETNMEFTDSTSTFNRVSFSSIFQQFLIIHLVYRAIPFIYELRAIIDWTVSKTSLDLFQWFKLEDAYAHLYLTRGEMAVRKQYAYGQARPFSEKIMFGCTLCSLMILIIILPLMIFSTINPILEFNNITGGSIVLEFISDRNAQTFYKFKIFENNNLDISFLSEEQVMFSFVQQIPQFKSFREVYKGIQEDSRQEYQKVTILPFSETLWDISSPNFRMFQQQLNDRNSKFYLSAKWQFKRPYPPLNQIAEGSNTFQLNREMKKGISTFFDQEDESTKQMKITNFFPKFLNLGMTPIAQVMQMEAQEINQQYEYPSLTHQAYLTYMNEDGDKYWIMKKIPNTNTKQDEFFRNQEGGITFIIKNDMVVGSMLGKGSNMTVIGLYVTVVIVFGKAIRNFFAGTSQRMVYTEMPYTDDLYEFMQGIYFARQEGKLNKEFYWFRLWVKIYRSPEILLRLTRDTWATSNFEVRKNI